MKLHALAAAIGAAVLLAGCIPTQIDANNASASPDAALAVPTPSVAPTATATAAATASSAPTATATAEPTATPEPKTPEPTARPTPPPTPRPTPVTTPQPTPPPTPAPTPTGNVAVQPNPPPNTTLGTYGKVTDAATGAPLANVCITVGIPGAICWGKTDANGNYAIDMVNPWSASPGQFEEYFILGGYATDHSPAKLISSVVRIDYAMHH